MATKLSLYKGALRVLGETTISALTDSRPARTTLDEIWDGAGGDGGIRELALSHGLWNFAIRTVSVEYNSAITPEFGYSRAFSKPEDWIITAAVSADGDFSVPFNDYEDEPDYWGANLDTLYIKYVSSHENYGYDLTRWTMNFTRYVEHLMAAEGAERITQSRVKKSDVLQLADDWLSRAKSVDAMDQPVRTSPVGSWVRARRGGGNPTRRSGGWEF